MSPIAVQRSHSIATIGADGIGPEVIDAGVQVLKKLAQLDGSFTLEFKDYDWSSETYKTSGKYIPDGGLDELKKHDAILFGAVGAPGMFIPPLMSSCMLILNRCTRPHFTLGPSPGYLPTIPAVCQCATHKDIPRY